MKSLGTGWNKALLGEGGICFEEGDILLLSRERRVIRGQWEAGDNAWPKPLMFLFVESREASRCWGHLLQVWVCHLRQC